MPADSVILESHQGDVIRIGDACYQFVGDTTQPVDTTASDTPEFSTCDDCLVSSSSESFASLTVPCPSDCTSKVVVGTFVPADVNLAVVTYNNIDCSTTPCPGGNDPCGSFIEFNGDVSRWEVGCCCPSTPSSSAASDDFGCGDWISAGSDVPSSFSIGVPSEAACFKLHYRTFVIPDRIIISDLSGVVLDTGCVATGSYDDLFFSTCDHDGDLEVEVIPNSFPGCTDPPAGSTLWDLRLTCLDCADVATLPSSPPECTVCCESSTTLSEESSAVPSQASSLAAASLDGMIAVYELCSESSTAAPSADSSPAVLSSAAAESSAAAVLSSAAADSSPAASSPADSSPADSSPVDDSSPAASSPAVSSPADSSGLSSAADSSDLSSSTSLVALYGSCSSVAPETSAPSTSAPYNVWGMFCDINDPCVAVGPTLLPCSSATPGPGSWVVGDPPDCPEFVHAPEDMFAHYVDTSPNNLVPPPATECCFIGTCSSCGPAGSASDISSTEPSIPHPEPSGSAASESLPSESLPSEPVPSSAASS